MIPVDEPGAVDPDDARRFAWALALVTTGAALLRVLALANQPLLADDLGAAVSAVNFVERGQVGPTMWHHPRLRDLLVYVAQLALGRSKLAVVTPSLLLGIAAIPLTGLLGRRLAGERAALIGALLLAVDPVHVDYSRQAVQEIYLPLFAVAGVLASLRFLEDRSPFAAVAAGLIFGLGLASKWSAAFPLAVIAAWSAWSVVRAPGRGTRPDLALVIATLTLLPAAVYLLTWAPWFEAGRGLDDWLALHRAMAAEATTHSGFNAATLEAPHRAATWFLWPSHYADAAVGAGGRVLLVAISNPFSWLATLPAVGALLRASWKERDSERGLLAALFLGGWFPFALAARPIWLHSALGVLPFAFLAVGWAADRVAARGTTARRTVGAWLAVVLLAAAPLWALATGVAAEVPGLRDVALRYRPATTLGAPADR